MLANSNDGKVPSAQGKTKTTKKILIFDWDHTITNRSLARHFRRVGDYDSKKEGAITEQDIKEFLKKGKSGIKNEEKLKCILQNAFKQGIEVGIASSTIYLKVVEYIVKNHLGLTDEQAGSVKVIVRNDNVQDFPKHCGKNVHILYLLKQYKEKYGTLPQEVMLVDDLKHNILCLSQINIIMEKLGGRDINDLLGGIKPEITKIEITTKELEGIEFKGVKVPEEQTTETGTSTDDNYLNRIAKWIGSEHSVPTTRNDKHGAVSTCSTSNGFKAFGYTYLGCMIIGLSLVGWLLCTKENIIPYIDNPVTYGPIMGGILILFAVVCAVILVSCVVAEICARKEENSEMGAVKTVFEDTLASGCQREEPILN